MSFATSRGADRHEPQDSSDARSADCWAGFRRFRDTYRAGKWSEAPYCNRRTRRPARRRWRRFEHEIALPISQCFTGPEVADHLRCRAFDCTVLVRQSRPASERCFGCLANAPARAHATSILRSAADIVRSFVNLPTPGSRTTAACRLLFDDFRNHRGVGGHRRRGRC